MAVVRLTVTSNQSFFGPLLGLLLASFAGWCTQAQAGDSDLGKQLRSRLRRHNVGSLSGFTKRFEWGQRQARYELGRALFFDPILSGNLDIACSTCHHPVFATSDGLALPIGVGGVGLGAGYESLVERTLGTASDWIPRNSPEIFNRTHPDWRTSFWDGRVEQATYSIETPAGRNLPEGLDDQLAAQALFPITSRHEMRGEVGESELGDVPDDNLPEIWDRVMRRLLSIPEYRTAFQQAFPLPPSQTHTIADYANAIADYEREAFTLTDSPFDRYLEGDEDALSTSQKRGALLFYGKANCVSCHSGSLMTDQEVYNLAVPQFGPGKVPFSGIDVGRMLVSGDLQDRYKFRTPSLHNVAKTGPWMHNGAFNSLRDAIVHHLDPVSSLLEYQGAHLPTELQLTIQNQPEFHVELLENAWMPSPAQATLSDWEIDDLVNFLESLTSDTLRREGLITPSVIPATVPSGLPVDGQSLLATPKFFGFRFKTGKATSIPPELHRARIR